jgi:hypothetical protein
MISMLLYSDFGLCEVCDIVDCWTKANKIQTDSGTEQSHGK